ncbi:hypothetical protein TNCV_1421431 [Trichonephila clavipes]|nr:hypothetical protein TNCV_1421431 [Trichonephila clavipes]
MVVAIVHPHDRYVINTLRAYQIANPDEKLSLSDVRRKIVLLYISENTGLTTKRRGPQGSKLMGGRVSTDVPIDPGNRFIVPTKIQKKCAYCNKKTTKKHHIDDLYVASIGKDREEGRITNVAREFDIAHSVVSRLWKSFKTTGMCSSGTGEVVLEVRRLREQIYRPISKRNSAPQLSGWQNQFLAASGKADLPKTVARRLRGGGLYARRPVVCPIDQTAPYCPFAMVS